MEVVALLLGKKVNIGTLVPVLQSCHCSTSIITVENFYCLLWWPFIADLLFSWHIWSVFLSCCHQKRTTIIRQSNNENSCRENSVFADYLFTKLQLQYPIMKCDISKRIKICSTVNITRSEGSFNSLTSPLKLLWWKMVSKLNSITSKMVC